MRARPWQRAQWWEWTPGGGARELEPSRDEGRAGGSQRLLVNHSDELRPGTRGSCVYHGRGVEQLRLQQ
eukprot:717023-Prymnesium_polylepis.1